MRFRFSIIDIATKFTFQKFFELMNEYKSYNAEKKFAILKEKNVNIFKNPPLPIPKYLLE